MAKKTQDFRLENDDIFRAFIAKPTSQGQLSSKLQEYLDAIEAALFEQVQTAYRLRLFETILGSMDGVILKSHVFI